MSMEIKFWGVRGSIASPGPETALSGGNTSCVEIRCGERRFICDAGTGIRKLGDQLLAEGPLDATLLLSHLHWDHIQGLPFFVPLYLPTTKLEVMGADPEALGLDGVLAQQMSAPVFPVRFEELASSITTRAVKHGERIDRGAVTIRVAKLNHPGGVLAYRLDYRGSSVVYATDTEHYSCVDPALKQLASGADVLIYDSQYTPEEYRGECGPSKVGWGHSTFEAGAELARAARVGSYVLFHHDPKRSDAALCELEARARALFSETHAAREGESIELSAKSAAA